MRRDDDNHELRRRLGQIQVVQSDLIPILKSCVPGQDDILFDMVLRLLVNLTNPELLLFREELPEEKTTRNYFLQLQQHRQAYKDAFVDDGLWKKLKDTLGTLLFRPQAERLEDDQLIIERILILVRNILQVRFKFIIPIEHVVVGTLICLRP